MINWAQLRAGQDWIRDRGLTLQQAFVLNYLTEHPGAMQRDIAGATRTTAANVSGVVRGLETRGLVERHTVAGDDRSKRVHATPAGIALLEGRDEAMARADETLLAPLDPSERETFNRLLDKITAGLPEPDPAQLDNR